MHTTEAIISGLKEKGLRRTKLREAVLNVLIGSHSPISVPELQSALKTMDLSPNKTSLYREIESLLEHGIADQTSLAGTRKYFVAASGRHHHHVICTSCEQTQCLELPAVEEALRQVRVQDGFAVTGHDLTLYGLCPHCR